MYIWRVWVSKDNIHCLFISHGCVFFNVSGRIVEHKPLQGCKPGHLLQGSAFPVFQWVCTSVPLCEYVCVCVCLAAPIQNHGHLHPEGTRSQIFFCQPKCIWTICRQQMSPLQSTAHSFYQRWLWSGRQGSHCLCVPSPHKASQSSLATNHPILPGYDFLWPPSRQALPVVFSLLIYKH